MDEHDGPYGEYEGSQLILRDHLAADRTRLANDRTLLAHVRTALAALVAGISLIQFFSLVAVHAVGWLLVLSSAAMLAAGITNHGRTKRRLRAIGKSESTGGRDPDRSDCETPRGDPAWLCHPNPVLRYARKPMRLTYTARRPAPQPQEGTPR